MNSRNLKNRIKKLKNIMIIALFIMVSYGIIGNISALSESFYNIIPYRNYVVTTGSMKPKILPGDYITIIKVNKDNLKVGDIITYKKDSMIVTHKIVDIYEEYIIPQGISNSIPDDPIKKEEVIGKYLFKIPSVGYIMAYLSSLSGLILIFGFLGIGVFLEKTNPKRNKEKENYKNKITVIRNIIFENLKNLREISKKEEKIIKKEKDIETLKKWNKVSARVKSVEEFYLEIKKK